MSRWRYFFRRLALSVPVVVYAYAVAFSAAVTAVAVALGVASGGGLVRAKYILFFAGFAVLMVGTAGLWPTSPEDLEEGDSIPEAREETRLEAVAQAVPPTRWLPAPPPGSRPSDGGRRFLAGLLVLLTSYAMEAVFGVA